MKYLLSFLFLSMLVGFSFIDMPTGKITSSADYNDFLTESSGDKFKRAEEENLFWDKKLNANPNQFPYKVKMAQSQNTLFELSGNVSYLVKASSLLEEANSTTNFSNPGILRALSRNYISQHRFGEALELLEKAELSGEGREMNQKMLFDAHLELGNNELAECYLNEISDKESFDYLIRLSKWSDHNGNLDQAIHYMEMAVEEVKKSGDQDLLQWSHTNLADFYGHAGRISDSYENYLSALSIDPSDAYAKKGLAWIAYSYERNADEAQRILNAISKTYQTPDLYLLQSEISSFNGDHKKSQIYKQSFEKAVSNEMYGNMYNKYQILYLTEKGKDLQTAHKLALKEVDLRPSPQSYCLLAWTVFKLGNKDLALEILETHFDGKSSEPEMLLLGAYIFEANQKRVKVEEYKTELEECIFELGPEKEIKINKL